jgi:hypothetical protein
MKKFCGIAMERSFLLFFALCVWFSSGFGSVYIYMEGGTRECELRARTVPQSCVKILTGYIPNQWLWMSNMEWLICRVINKLDWWAPHIFCMA